MASTYHWKVIGDDGILFFFFFFFEIPRWLTFVMGLAIYKSILKKTRGRQNLTWKNFQGYLPSWKVPFTCLIGAHGKKILYLFIGCTLPKELVGENWLTLIDSWNCLLMRRESGMWSATIFSTLFLSLTTKSNSCNNKIHLILPFYVYLKTSTLGLCD